MNVYLTNQNNTKKNKGLTLMINREAIRILQTPPLIVTEHKIKAKNNATNGSSFKASQNIIKVSVSKEKTEHMIVTSASTQFIITSESNSCRKQERSSSRADTINSVERQYGLYNIKPLNHKKKQTLKEVQTNSCSVIKSKYLYKGVYSNTVKPPILRNTKENVSQLKGNDSSLFDSTTIPQDSYLRPENKHRTYSSIDQQKRTKQGSSDYNTDRNVYCCNCRMLLNNSSLGVANLSIKGQTLADNLDSLKKRTQGLLNRYSGFITK